MNTLRIVSIRSLYSQRQESTRGVFLVDGVFWGYTLEDVVRRAEEPKVHGRTAIPAGIYQVGMHNSPRFKKHLPHLKDVPGFNYILAHGGNRVMDTEGCILVASQYKAADWIFGSLSDRLAAEVDKALKGGRQVTWEIIDTVHD